MGQCDAPLFLGGSSVGPARHHFVERVKEPIDTGFNQDSQAQGEIRQNYHNHGGHEFKQLLVLVEGTPSQYRYDKAKENSTEDGSEDWEDEEVFPYAPVVYEEVEKQEQDGECQYIFEQHHLQAVSVGRELGPQLDAEDYHKGHEQERKSVRKPADSELSGEDRDGREYTDHFDESLVVRQELRESRSRFGSGSGMICDGGATRCGCYRFVPSRTC